MHQTQKVYSEKRPILFGIVFILVNLTSFSVFSQAIIELPHKDTEGVEWDTKEREFFSEAWGGLAITNVARPELVVFKAPEKNRKDISVILSPGGGIYALSMQHEGYSVAKWLNEQGITAFILKYRLVPTGEDGIAELAHIASTDNNARIKKTQKILPYAVQDGLSAVSYVRNNAKSLGVSPNKIGFMGFSGGGVILFGVMNEANMQNRPNFLIPVYPGTDLILPKPDKHTPPTLFIAAANDQLIDATVFTGIFNQFHTAGVSTGIYLYNDGGHGFGTWLKDKPASKWLESSYEWMMDLSFEEE
ncbi:alpha/beta hydrolase [Agaribacter marinus]|uniref:Endo-1,4-beta-xylanase n=1 Tax=Agaribacter marinus TaxID=1431249 RepID=A0AA37T0C4_9ALTE|nr:alpha/beta hydrolase [Agaribacter marinus]GLR71355.1 endo-1,4-beta-xylanase [Agaribacter marinus]